MYCSNLIRKLHSVLEHLLFAYRKPKEVATTFVRTIAFFGKDGHTRWHSGQSVIQNGPRAAEWHTFDFGLRLTKPQAGVALLAAECLCLGKCGLSRAVVAQFKVRPPSENITKRHTEY